MPFDIRYDAEKECIYVTFTGDITMPLVYEYLDSVHSHPMRAFEVA